MDWSPALLPWSIPQLQNFGYASQHCLFSLFFKIIGEEVLVKCISRNALDFRSVIDMNVGTDHAHGDDQGHHRTWVLWHACNSDHWEFSPWVWAHWCFSSSCKLFLNTSWIVISVSKSYHLTQVNVSIDPRSKLLNIRWPKLVESYILRLRDDWTPTSHSFKLCRWKHIQRPLQSSCETMAYTSGVILGSVLKPRYLVGLMVETFFQDCVWKLQDRCIFVSFVLCSFILGGYSCTNLRSFIEKRLT